MEIKKGHGDSIIISKEDNSLAIVQRSYYECIEGYSMETSYVAETSSITFDCDYFGLEYEIYNVFESLIKEIIGTYYLYGYNNYSFQNVIVDMRHKKIRIASDMAPDEWLEIVYEDTLGNRKIHLTFYIHKKNHIGLNNNREIYEFDGSLRGGYQDCFKNLFKKLSEIEIRERTKESTIGGRK